MKKRTKCLLLIVMLLALLSMCTYGYSFAKYVTNSAWNYYLGTKGFYFSSDELGIDKITNVNNNWDNDSIHFILKNSENDYLISDYNIEYTVKCTVKGDAANYSKCVLNGTENDVFDGVLSSSGKCVDNKYLEDVSGYNQKDCNDNNYEWIIQENYKDLYFDVVKTGNEELNYVSVLIEVTTNAPYSKKILGEFNLSSATVLEQGLDMEYNEYDNYNRLVIVNSYDEDKCVKLSFDSKDLRIDENNKNISSFGYDENGYINEIKFNISKKNSLSYIFYKTDLYSEIKYDKSKFNLIESNDC